MAGWTLKNADEQRDGLTIYQLQELVRSGRIGPDAEVSDGGPLQRVRDVPRLAALLPAEEGSGPAPRTILVGGLELELGPDGKPLPPSPDVVAKLLAGESDVERGRARAERTRKVVLVVCAVMISAALLMLVRVLATAE